MKNLTITLSCNAILLLFFIPMNIKSCDGEKGEKYTAPDALIEMSKTACFGKCPVYTISIDGKGNAVYTGKQNVDKIGEYKKTFSAEEVNALIDAFEKSNFWDYEDEYTEKVTDVPTTYISYTRGTKTKKIKDYFGAPDSLKKLENAVEALANAEGWVATSGT